MDAGTGWRIAILAGLLLVSAFFSSSETALMSFSRIRLRRLVESGDPAARGINRLVESPSRLLSTILIGNNLVNTAISAIATTIALRFVLEDRNALLIATLVTTTVILVVGEITPKAIAASTPETVARWVYRPVTVLVWLLSPLNRLFAAATDRLMRAAGRPARREPSITEEDVRTMMLLGQQQGVFAPEEQRMIERIFEFGDLRVREVMVPRVEVVGIPRDVTRAELLDLVRREHFTRYPVYEDDLDHVIGVLHVKELMIEAPQRGLSPEAVGPNPAGAGGHRGPAGFDVADFARPAYFVPDSKRVVELLREMRQQHTHMAIVVDEYGGTAGVVTLEDLVEEVLGDISDEFDHREKAIRRVDDHTLSVAGTLRLEELNDQLGVKIVCEQADTVAGLVMSQLGRIPQPGDRAEQAGVLFEVEQMDGHRIERVRVRTGGTAAGSEARLAPLDPARRTDPAAANTGEGA